jgi:hypothetical protein
MSTGMYSFFNGIQENIGGFWGKFPRTFLIFRPSGSPEMQLKFGIRSLLFFLTSTLAS